MADRERPVAAKLSFGYQRVKLELTVQSRTIVLSGKRKTWSKAEKKKVLAQVDGLLLKTAIRKIKLIAAYETIDRWMIRRWRVQDTKDKRKPGPSFWPKGSHGVETCRFRPEFSRGHRCYDR